MKETVTDLQILCEVLGAKRGYHEDLSCLEFKPSTLAEIYRLFRRKFCLLIMNLSTLQKKQAACPS